MTDADGVTIVVGDGVWYDDGHSADWVHGQIQAFPNPQSARIKPDNITIPVFINIPLIHKNKPTDPPDH